MMRLQDFLALVRLSLAEPEEGARAVMALNPPMTARWLLLALPIVLSVLLQYLPLALSGQTAEVLSPFAMTATQGAMNLAIVLLVAFVGRAAGGTGSFADALLLVGWLQIISLLFLLGVLALGLLGAGFELIGVVASALVTFWLMVGFICALHGFRSRGLVLLGSIAVLVLFSLFLSFILVMLGFAPVGVADV